MILNVGLLNLNKHAFSGFSTSSCSSWFSITITNYYCEDASFGGLRSVKFCGWTCLQTFLAAACFPQSQVSFAACDTCKVYSVRKLLVIWYSSSDPLLKWCRHGVGAGKTRQWYNDSIFKLQTTSISQHESADQLHHHYLVCMMLDVTCYLLLMYSTVL